MVACVQAASMELILSLHSGMARARRPANQPAVCPSGRSVVNGYSSTTVASGAPVEDLQVVKGTPCPPRGPR
eukprot:6856759-Prymnesium_polylepis.1